MANNDRTTIILPSQMRLELKIMCAMTNKRMSDFIRIAVQEKMRKVRETSIGIAESGGYLSHGVTSGSAK